ncbi:tetratricopeptide repeat protein [Xanthocytophaga flava]|uniref:tetratricopeptide repeat protein n=1 Tax=Xanthocytophaga flava TaxID=3048013 RepID=UPI0028D70F79|nr:tetratricopeptide repeat protein [Xanthocytophaga flavus]MDJ1471560.1 tetratricopeptide repeat protein [Xanthocytophaga flavus]
MIANSHLQRAEVLIEQGRYDMAEKELRNLLGQEPQNTVAMRMLANCLLQTNRQAEAVQITQTLLTIEPDEPYNLYIHAIVLSELEKYKEAESFIRQAIEMYPHEADFFHVLSIIFLNQKRWQDALQYADEGLNIDPNHLGCLNIRTTALTKLNRKQEALATIEDVLEQDPDNAWSHANVGWAKLEQGNPQAAKIHFAEALRLNPTMEIARSGMLEALKAQNFLYRIFLQFFFWLNRHQGKTQWGIIIGIYILNRILNKVSDQYPFLRPVAVLVTFLIYLTWIINPLFNLFLRLDKYGKHILTDKEKEGANWVGTSLGIAVLSLVGWFISDELLLLALTIFGATMVLPLSRFFDAVTPREIRIYKLYTIGLSVIGFITLIGIVLNQSWIETTGTIYLIGIFLFGWIANSMIIK